VTGTAFIITENKIFSFEGFRAVSASSYGNNGRCRQRRMYFLQILRSMSLL